VDFFPREGGALEQWKREEAGEVFFTYLFRERGETDEAAQPLSQDDFRRRYQPASLEQVLPEVQDAWSLVGGENDGKVMQDLLFPRGSVLPGEVRINQLDPDQVESYKRIPAFFDNQGLVVLDGARNILRSSEGGGRVITLPAPPPGCVYTSLVGSAEWWVLGWEESLFPLVGRAGLLFFPR
jgi:hypothetical protein